MGGTKSSQSQGDSPDSSAQTQQGPEDRNEEYLRQAEEDRAKAREDLEAAKAKTQAEAQQASTSDT